MPLLTCIAAYAIDGDSMRCRNLGEIRLLAIDAPDRTSSRPCKEHFGDHVCDDAGAKTAKVSLRQALLMGPVTVEPVGRDRYGRMLALVKAGGADLSCYQLHAGVARYIVRYDNGHRLARICNVR
jgi:micrococcal nuclease